MEELKVGDYVAGKEGNGYAITNGDMTCGRVVKVNGDDIKVKVLLHKSGRNIGGKYEVKADGFVKIEKPEEVKERIILQPELDEILANHKKWLETGRKGEIRADLSDADLSDADLSGANLSDADLSDANLSRADLSGANLSRADLSDANLSRADLSGANLSRADLSGANLSRADLSGANLSRADLSGADLSGANLSRADLSDANLSDANLSRADLSDADLSRADLSGANLSGTISARQANFIGANIDYCKIPMSCRSLGWIIDRRLAAQFAYHFCSHNCDDKAVKAAQNALLSLANEFHRVGECGKLAEKTIEDIQS